VSAIGDQALARPEACKAELLDRQLA
jgi:hypothetical protein